MASIYARGSKLWARLKDEANKWISRPTPFSVGQEAEAERYADAAQRTIDGRRSAGETSAPLTVTAYAEKWFVLRAKLGKRSADKEEGRMRKHVLPRLGPMRLDAITKLDIRDFVRAMRMSGELAPRSIRNIYGDMQSMFRDAVDDGHITINPCSLRRGELPSKVDKDPEWRDLATYTVREVERLISDTAIPVERRVLNALKALGGLRHGEAAGLRWRHYDPTLEPLGRLIIATSYDTGRTKTEVTRRVPVHPVLAKILAAWRISHWERIYGRAPTSDDLIVPARTMSPIAVEKAGGYFKADLEASGFVSTQASIVRVADTIYARGSSPPRKSTVRIATWSASSRTPRRAMS